MNRRQLLSTIPLLGIAACGETLKAKPRNEAVVMSVGSERASVTATSTRIVMPPVLQPTDPNAITTFGFIPFNGVAVPAQTTTFALPLPDKVLLPTDGISIGGAAAQLDAASLYPSGYLRHALIAVQLQALAAGGVHIGSLTKAAKPSGTAPALACSLVATFTPVTPATPGMPATATAPAVSATPEIVGTPITVDVGAAVAAGKPDILRQGPLVTEGRFYIPLPGLDHMRLTWTSNASRMAPSGLIRSLIAVWRR